MFDVGIAEAVADLPKASAVVVVIVAAAVVVAIAVVEDIAVAEGIVAAEAVVVAVGIAFVVFGYVGPSFGVHFEKLGGS